MKFLLHINADPSSPFSEAAFHFARAALAQKHRLDGVFFSGLAVSTFSRNTSNAALAAKWSSLLFSLSQQALCCSSASTRYFDHSSPPAQVEIAGLGQLVELCAQADRVICFGS